MASETETDSDYCGTSSPDDGYAKQMWCGITSFATAVGDNASDVVDSAAETLQLGIVEGNETSQKAIKEAGKSGRKGIGAVKSGTWALAIGLPVGAIAVDALVFGGAFSKRAIGIARGFLG